MLERKTLAKYLRERIDRDNERKLNDPMWWVRLSEPCPRIFCARTKGKDEIGTDITVLAVLMRDRYEYTPRETEQSDVMCVELEPERESFAVPESFMGGFMQAIRSNGLHGEYWRARDIDERYKF